MPYIKHEQRVAVKNELVALVERLKTFSEDEQDGVVNYCISQMLRHIYPLKYRHQNRAMGVLECVKQEHYRRMVGPYEDIKINENGDLE